VRIFFFLTRVFILQKQQKKVYRELRHFDLALEALDGSRSIYIELTVEKSEEYGKLLHAYGTLEFARGHDQLALQLHQQAKAMLLENGFQDSEIYFHVLTELAHCHAVLGEYEQCIAYRAEATQLRRQRFGDDHPEYATALYSLACTLYKFKRFDDAAGGFEKAFDIWSVRLGPAHSSTINAQENLGLACQALRDPANAKYVSDKRMCRVCDQVGRVGAISKCGLCDRAYYCGKPCQQQDWPRHRLRCQMLATRRWCFNCKRRDGDEHKTKCQQCSGCKHVFYCSSKCSKQSWLEHKSDCKKWKKEQDANKK